MSAAARVHVCRGASGTARAVALVAGLWLIIGGVFGMRHEAHVAHFVDGVGQSVHASRMIGQHEVGSQSDIHGQADTDNDHGICAVSTTLHQPASPEHAAAGVEIVAPTQLDGTEPPAHGAVISGRVYRLAPKTSPPIA